jgi:hypothetical protein
LALLKYCPTAVHAEADVHDTARPRPLIPVGVGWMAQAVPFHRSARILRNPPPGLAAPTAVHATAEVHDTPARPLDDEPPGLGVGWTAQAVPCHRSASDTTSPALLVTYCPTAVHAEADVHDTPLSPTFVAPPGLGVGVIDHAGVVAAPAAGVMASIVPAPRATVAKAAAYLPDRRREPKPKVNKARTSPM